MFRLSTGLVAWTYVLAGIIAASATGQERGKLSAAERARAIAIERQAVDNAPAALRRDVPTNRPAAARASQKSVVTSVVPIGEVPVPQTARQRAQSSQGQRPQAIQRSPARRRAEVTRYNYGSGETTRTTIDIDSGEIIDTRSDKNFPTPLAAVELREAKSLLLAAAPEVRRLVDVVGEAKVEFVHLVSVAPSPASKSYGQRVVAMWVKKPKRSRRYVINLTTGEVK